MPTILQLAGLVTELQHSFTQLPLDGPKGWLLLGVLAVFVPVGPWLLRRSGRQFHSGYAMLANEAVGAGEAHRESGAVEVEGTAATLGETVSGKYTGEPALAQKWHRKEEEETTDADGNTTTSTRLLGSGSDAVPFLVEDETGSVAVDPAGASLSISASHVHRAPTDIKHYEGRIEPGDSVYVYGQLIETADPADAPGEKPTYVGSGNDVPEFVVSDSGQMGTVLEYFLTGGMMSVVGIAVTLLVSVLFSIAVEEVFGVPAASWLIERL